MTRNALRQNTTLLTVFLITLASWLRFWRLGRQSLWYDEVGTVLDSSHPFREIHQALMTSPPLFSYIVRVFYLIFGKNDFWLRAPSAFFGVLTIPFAFHSIDRLVGRRAAFWGTLLWTLSPFHLIYSQELRMYTLIALESLGSLYFWNLALEQDSPKYWFLFILFNTLGLYTHNWFVFFLCSQIAGFLWYGFQHKRLSKSGLLSFIGIGLSYIPWLQWLKKQAAQDLFTHSVASGFYHLQVTIEAFAGTRIPSGHSWVVGNVFSRALGCTLSIVLVLIGLFKSGPHKTRTARLFIFGFLMPLLIGYLISITYKPIYHGGRYTIIALPAYFISIARAFDDRLSRWRAGIQLLGVTLISLWVGPLFAYYTSYQKAPWKELGKAINTRAAQNDGVTYYHFDALNRMALDYYIRPSLKRFEAFEAGPDIHHLFLPVLTSAKTETARVIPPPWHVRALHKGNEVGVFMLERIPVKS